MPAPFSLFTRIPFWVQILAGLVLGVVLGLVARSGDVAWLTTTLTTVGEHLRPAAQARRRRRWSSPRSSSASPTCAASTNAARLAGRTLLWFMITSLIAVVVGLGLGLLTNPGRGVTLDTGARRRAGARRARWTDFLTGIIPTNPSAPFVDGNVLQIVFLARRRRRRRPAARRPRPSRSSASTARCWSWSRRRCGGSSGSPRSARSGLIGKAVSQYGWDLLAPLATFTVDVYLGCLLVLVRASTRVLLGFGRLSPRSSTRAPGRRSSWPSSPAPRSARCR